MRFRSLLLFFTAFACLLLPLSAQTKPKENAKVLVGVKLAAIDAVSTINTRMYGGGESSDLFSIYSNGPGSGLHYIDSVNVLMTPGKHYQMTMTCGAWTRGLMRFSAPPGYTIYLDDRPIPTRGTDFYNGGYGSYFVFKIVLKANDESGLLPAGVALPPTIGDSVWSISVGRYANGLSAGAVQWRASTLSQDLLDVRSLIYADPNSPEVFVTKHSDNGLLEIDTFQCIMYFKRNTTPGTGYTVEVYQPTAIRSGSGDGPFTYSEAPYRRYTVSNPDASWNNRIKIEKIELDSSRSETWTLSKQGNDWSIVETNGLRTSTLASTLASNGNREETVTVSGGGVTGSKIKRIYNTFPWGQEELTQEIADPDGLALTTSYDYYTSAGASYGRLKSMIKPTGGWERYEYSEGNFNWGDLAAIYRPWQDAPASPASATASNCDVTLYSFASWGTYFSDSLPSGTERKVLGTTVAKNTSYYYCPADAPNGQPLQTEVTQTYSSSDSYVTSSVTSYRDTAAPNYRFRVYSQVNSDTTKSSALRYQAYFWNYGDLNATDFHKWPDNPSANRTWGEYLFTGFSTHVQDSVAVNSWDGESFETVYMVPNRSTVQLRIYNAEGQVASTTQYVFTGASSGVPTFEFLSTHETGYQNGVAVIEKDTNGQEDRLSMIGGQVSGISYNDGTYIEYTRDALGRDYLVRKWYVDSSGEYSAQGIIYTHKTFDIVGRVLSEKSSSSSDATANPTDAVTTTRKYNLAGLLTEEVAEAGAGNFKTTYTYSNGTRTITTTLPGGATKTVENYLDGSPKSITGTAQVATYYTTVNSDGTVTAQTNTVAANSPRWNKATTNWMGNTIKSENPSYNGGTFVRQAYYNNAGQLIKTGETGLADKLVIFNAWQRPYRTGLDMNGSGSLEPDSSDRINETDSYYEKDAQGAWWSVSSRKVYNKTGATPTTVNTTKQRLNKYSYNSTGLQSESVSIDVFGNESRQKVVVDRPSRTITTTTHNSDSSIDEISVVRNGLLQKTQTKQGLISRFYYDARGRPVKQTDPRVDTSSTPRVGFVSNSDRAAWTEDSAGNRTTMAYYSDTGLLYASTNPLGKASYASYDAMGRVIHTWGPATYPITYTFNAYGEQTGMQTYRDTSTDWTPGTWPANAPAGDSTTKDFEAATGLLLSKTDAQGRAVTYTYNVRGQLATRTWARGVKTTYSYDPKTSEQTSISYSDSTHAVAYGYDRAGLNTSISDEIGTRTLGYADSGKLTAEYLPSFYQNREVHWSLDTSTLGAVGRTTLLSFGTQGDGTNEYGVGFGYDSYGRLSSVLGMNYTYTPNSNLIATVSDPQGQWSQQRNYDSDRNLLYSVNTTYSTATRSSFVYGHDALARPKTFSQSGDIFSSYAGGGLSTTWGYNDRSEMTSSQTTFIGSSVPVIGRNFGYSYDSIGNRLSSSVEGTASAYTPNSLNQYTQRAVPGSVLTTGFAPANATVTANGQTATRQSDYFGKVVGVDNSSSSVWANISINSDLGGSFNRFSFVPRTPESYTYDEDGNIKTDGRWSYEWDAENRLSALETRSIAFAAGAPRQRIEFRYDYLGRRVQKRVANWSGPGWSLNSERRYIYDGWNLMAEADTTTGFAWKMYYVWGIDLSGDLQGAGGVGGLLWVCDRATGSQLMPAYDGNGNVYGMIDRFSGALRASYEYSPYGEVLRANGDMADKNPFRFSTKYADAESQMLYYGFRYYSPSLGRFYGRDPIEEKGGVHLYSFAKNSPSGGYDLLGKDYVQNFVYNTSTPVNPITNSGSATNSFSVGGVSFNFSIVATGNFDSPQPSTFNSKGYKITLANGQQVPMYLDNVIVDISTTKILLPGNQVRFGNSGGVQLIYQYDPKINGYYLLKAIIPTAPAVPPSTNPPGTTPTTIALVKKTSPSPVYSVDSWSGMFGDEYEIDSGGLNGPANKLGNALSDKDVQMLYDKALTNIQKNNPDFYDKFMTALAQGNVLVDAYTNRYRTATLQTTGQSGMALEGGLYNNWGRPDGGAVMNLVINSNTTLEELEATITHEGTHMIDAQLYGYNARNWPTIDLELNAYTAEDNYMMKNYGKHASSAGPYINANGQFDPMLFRQLYFPARGMGPSSPWINVVRHYIFKLTLRY